jgi:phosphohistidine phosphatase SixA
MAKVYLLRHGHYDIMSGSLTDKGRKELELTSEMLKDDIDGSAIILFSPARRTKESAEQIAKALAKELSIKFKECPRLAIGNYKVPDIIKDYKDEKALILVTHQPIIEDYLTTVGIYSLIKTGEYIKVNIE